VNATASGGVTVSDSSPVDPSQGDGWFYAEDGTQFVRYDDGNSIQWVQPNAVLSSQIEQRYYSPNYIINGAFEINQRNFTSINTNAAFGFDRWSLFFSGGTITNTPQSFSPGDLVVAGFEGSSFSRLVTSGFSSGFGIYRQQVENVRTLAGRTATISFWAKAGSGSPKIMPAVEQLFGSGGSPSAAVRTQASPVTISTSWARYSATVSVPSIVGKTIGTNANSSSLSVELWLSGSDAGNQNATFDIWGVQLEEGTTASPFRRNANSIQGELAACQRYYQRIAGDPAQVHYPIGVGRTLTNSCFAVIKLAQNMRVRPSLAFSGAFVVWTTTNYTVSSISTDVVGYETIAVLATASGVVAGQCGNLHFPTATAANFIEISAEL
jgi:hypothetical protein